MIKDREIKELKEENELLKKEENELLKNNINNINNKQIRQKIIL
jgi:hypothetical protein